MLFDDGGHFLSVGRKGADSRFLILPHEAAVAFDIGTEDSSELTLHICSPLNAIIALPPHMSIDASPSHLRLSELWYIKPDKSC